MSTEFEKVTCGRCGGTGHYSYNQISGTTCFGCNGSGKKLTKRGAAAYAWFKAQRSIPAKEVKVGQRVKVCGYEMTVGAIEPDLLNVGQNRLNFLSVTGKLTCGTFTDSLLEVIPRTAAEKNAALRAAWAYQDTLGKNGKPLKTSKPS